MLRTFVKIGAVNNLSDARYCAGMMVDQIGFELESDIITKDLFEAITGWIEGVKLVGEFEGTDINTIKTTLLDFPVDYVQVTNPDLIDSLESENYKLILKTGIDNLIEILEQHADQLNYILLEDHDVTLEQLSGIPSKEKIVLASQVDPENIDEIVQMGFKGIAMKGGDEIRPGVKDFDQLADILEKLEVD